MVKKRNQLHFRFKDKEWAKINHHANIASKRGVIGYITMQLIELEKNINLSGDADFDTPEITKRRTIEYHNSERISKLCKKMGTTPSTLVSRYILAPLITKPIT